jgi:hypothetical protein
MSTQKGLLAVFVSLFWLVFWWWETNIFFMFCTFIYRITSSLANFTFMWPCIVTNFPIINQLDALISQIYFGMKLYIFRTVPLSIIRSYSLYTQQWYMSYRFVDSFQAGSGWN